MSKEVADLTKQLRQLFFEGKTVRKQLAETERAQRVAKNDFEKILKQNNLVQVQGSIKPKQKFEQRLKQLIKEDMIPNYADV
jgi:hypothetical protein